MELSRVDPDVIAEAFPNSRFRILDHPTLPPGVCAICGSAGDGQRQFVDFGKTEDFYGVFYFCTFCVAEVAQIIGFGATKSLKEEINTLQNGCAERDIEITSLQERLSATRLLLRNCHCNDSDSLSDSHLSDSMDVESVERSDEINYDTVESSSVEGSSSFPDLGTIEFDEPGTTNTRKRTRKSAE